MSKNHRQRKRQKPHMLASIMSENLALTADKHFLPSNMRHSKVDICLPAREMQQPAQGGHYINIMKLYKKSYVN